MNVETVNLIVERCLPLRPPRWSPATSPREKVSDIENYLTELAYAQADLSEALHWLELVVENATQQIKDMTGYEACLPPKSRERITKDDVLAAKRLAQPAPFLAGAEARRLKATAVSQITRFRFEFDVMSRLYTVISGS